jgi:hypothetical protein
LSEGSGLREIEEAIGAEATMASIEVSQVSISSFLPFSSSPFSS